MTNNGRERATLERTLGLGTVVLIGLAYMTPLIVLGTYGVVAQLSNGTVPTAYLVMLLYLTRGFRQAPPQLGIDEETEPAP
jgi:putrescine importer